MPDRNAPLTETGRLRLGPVHRGGRLASPPCCRRLPAWRQCLGGPASPAVTQGRLVLDPGQLPLLAVVGARVTNCQPADSGCVSQVTDGCLTARGR
jgi:hypothetical protein